MTNLDLSYAEAINRAIDEEMEFDERVVTLGEDVAGGPGIPGFERRDAWGGVFGVTQGLVAKYGRGRVLDTPLSEAAFIGCSVGAATAGLRPIVELQFIDFMGVCFDQMMNQAAKYSYIHGGLTSGVPMVIRTMYGTGLRSAAHQGGSHYAAIAHFPGLKVVAPSTPLDAYGLMRGAVRDNDPVVFLEHKALYEQRQSAPEDKWRPLELGRANITRQGTDVTVVGIGKMALVAEDASMAAEVDGISCEVIDLRTVAPIDLSAILTSVAKTGRLVVVDEDTPRCSVASDIVSLVAERAFSSLVSPPRTVTAPHTPTPFSPVLEDAYAPDRAKTFNAILEVATNSESSTLAST